MFIWEQLNNETPIFICTDVVNTTLVIAKDFRDNTFALIINGLIEKTMFKTVEEAKEYFKEHVAVYPFKETVLQDGTSVFEGTKNKLVAYVASHTYGFEVICGLARKICFTKDEAENYVFKFFGEVNL